MGESKLAWWVFRCLTLTFVVGALFILYAFFRIYDRSESASIRRELNVLTLLAADIFAKNKEQGFPSSSGLNTLCQQLALQTKKRVTVVNNFGMVLGDSVYGSHFNLGVSKVAEGFSKWFDPVSSSHVLANTQSILSDEENGQMFVRLSMPVMGNWKIVGILLKETAILIFSFFCLIVLGSVIISNKIIGFGFYFSFSYIIFHFIVCFKLFIHIEFIS